MTNANNWTKWPAIIWLVICFCLLSGINGQNQKAIATNSVFEKTTFTCAGRPAGYYADIETGCQVYHMCDGLGRQFSYSCPNTTLFQQRMLICDHWYMVNCSKAESHYAANLLIGQRDKPFVNDEENSLRTPRPDLLDRPYAPDYSGESFRNQYKTSPVPNQIQDTDSEKNNIKSLPFVISSQHNWKIPPPSRIILPPAYETENNDSEKDKQFSSQTSISATNSSKNISTITSTNIPTTISLKTLKEQNSANYKYSALSQRNQDYHTTDNDDLGTSHSTRYNTSADYNSAEISPAKSVNIYNKGKFENSPRVGDLKNQIKIPSKIYQPPFLYPIFNEDNTHSTEAPIRISSAVPFTTPTKQFTTTTRQPLSKPTTHAGKPFSIPTTTISSKTFASDVHNKSNSVLQNQRFDFHKTVKNARTPAPAQGFKPPTPRPPTHFTKTLKAPAISLKSDNYTLDSKTNSTSRPNLPIPTNPATSGIASSNTLKPDVPIIELLPPFREFIQHDIATTQGPPIYYEWKVPSNGLEPPKFDPPIGVDGREYPDTIIDYNSISSASKFAPFNEVDPQKTSASIKTPITTTNSLQTSPRELSTTRPPTLRSVKDTAQPNSLDKSVIPKSANSAATPISPTAPTDIVQLRKELSVPEYAFPLETIGRTGYLNIDSYNSFQLKIPEHHTDADEHLHWYGENPECPECHPSYVVPGTCQPCLRR